jgi:hypothetical protein
MAKKPSKRERGRPLADNPKDQRVLVRFDAATREALGSYVIRSGLDAVATAVRVIVTERLRKDGLL